MYSDRPSPSRGFTLLEVVGTLIILGILGAMTFSGFGSALTGYALMREAGTTTMQAELALIRLQKELSGATFDIEIGNSGKNISFLGSDAQTATAVSLSGNEILLSRNDGTETVLLNRVTAQQDKPFVRIEKTAGTGDPALITLSFLLTTESGSIPFSLSVSPRNTPPVKN